MSSAQHPLIDCRYQILHGLGRGGMGEVFCARDRLTGSEVALKRVALHAQASTHELYSPGSPGSPGGPSGPGGPGRGSLPEQATVVAAATAALGVATVAVPRVFVRGAPGRSDALRFALAQEFRTLASLRHPNIISVLDYGFDAERQPYFTMELLTDARPLLQAAAELPLLRRVELVGQLLLALSYLHRRGVLHRDLKPSNTLVIPAADGLQLKVLDFGLAVAGDSRQRLRAEVAGTLGYMAPEVLLGAPPSEASDLYAVGVIACEVLTGSDPFDGDNSDDEDLLLKRAIEREPNRERLAPLGAIGAVVARLLSRAPEARFPSASATLLALAAASGVPLGEETAAVRESFLQAAPLIGRESDWRAARAHLDRLLAGTGGGVLIGGESGIGKSRFLDELRAHGMVRGIHVVRGQAVSSSGGAYHVLRDALPPLCLSAQLSDAEAAVLKALLPELPQLLGRPLEDAPAVDAQATQLRLLTTFEALLSRQDAPTALLLEDLQWADGESMSLLMRALTVAKTRPLLIVGTFRNDERPQLVQELAGATVLSLRRLPSADIAALCRSMLGAPPPEQLVELVARETEGNVFFVIEVMRALAEEAGGLALIGQGSLPDHVLTGGIRAVLQRRLDRVPAPARPLLLLAAVAGRQIDPLMLATLEPRLDEWLQGCADAAVLEVSDQRWRFAHDKLREALLRELDPSARRELHQRVALALEAAYPGGEARAAELSYHFAEAGERRAAARYAVLAGELALRQGALTEAAALLQQATECMDTLADTPQLDWVRANRLYAQSLFGLVRMQDCVDTCEKVLSRVNVPWRPRARKLERAGVLLELLAAHALHEAWPELTRVPQSASERALLGEILQLTVAAGEIYAYLGRPLELAQCILAGMELGRTLGDARNQVLTTSVAAFLLSLTPLHALAPRYLARAEELAHATPDPHAKAQLCRIGGLVHLFSARWEVSDELFARGAKLWRSLGADLLLMFTLGQRAYVGMLSGNLDRSLSFIDEISEVAILGRHGRYVLWASARRNMLLARRNQHTAALTELREVDRQVRSSQDRIIQATTKAGLVAAAVRTRDLPTALLYAAEIVPMIPSGVTGYNYMEALIEALNAMLTAREQRPELAAGAAMDTQLGEAQRLLRIYARALLIGRPHAHVLESRIAALRGQHAAALRHAEKGLERALQLRMPYEQALAHEQLGRLLLLPPRRWLRRPHEVGDPARAAEHLTAARALYAGLGDVWRVSAIDALADP